MKTEKSWRQPEKNSTVPSKERQEYKELKIEKKNRKKKSEDKTAISSKYWNKITFNTMKLYVKNEGARKIF